MHTQNSFHSSRSLLRNWFFSCFIFPVCRQLSARWDGEATLARLYPLFFCVFLRSLFLLASMWSSTQWLTLNRAQKTVEEAFKKGKMRWVLVSCDSSVGASSMLSWTEKRNLCVPLKQKVIHVVECEWKVETSSSGVDEFSYFIFVIVIAVVMRNMSSWQQQQQSGRIVRLERKEFSVFQSFSSQFSEFSEFFENFSPHPTPLDSFTHSWQRHFAPSSRRRNGGKCWMYNK